jgi:hypothetical protein
MNLLSKVLTSRPRSRPMLSHGPLEDNCPFGRTGASGLRCGV